MIPEIISVNQSETVISHETEIVEIEGCVIGYNGSLVYIMENRAKVVFFSEALENNKKSILTGNCQYYSIPAIEVSSGEYIGGYNVRDVGVITVPIYNSM